MVKQTVEIQGKKYEIRFPISDFYFSALIKFVEGGYLKGGKDAYNTACDALLKYIPDLESSGLILKDGADYTLVLGSRDVGEILAALQDLYFPPQEPDDVDRELESLKSQLSEASDT